jgi:DNA repair protein RecN (Recombination protein N)
MEKLDLYNKIKKKFGPTLVEVKNNYQQMAQELETLTNLEDNLAVLNQKIDKLHAKCMSLAQALHKKRTSAAQSLALELTKLVRSLKMNGASLRIDLEQLNELSSTGITSLKFLAETNPGEGFYKIKDIASGGELSRILLAIRQILATKDSISVFLFDEIDTGMGGETALCIGKSLKEVSKSSQVIAITHLPQIATNADKLIVVSKETNSVHNRTSSKVSEITGLDRAKEISAMVPLS